jgi:hypothetical protein
VITTDSSSAVTGICPASIRSDSSPRYFINPEGLFN